MPFLVNILFSISDLCMTVHGTAGHLKTAMIILEISDRTVLSISVSLLLICATHSITAIKKS
jgi:hypothetical protein